MKEIAIQEQRRIPNVALPMWDFLAEKMRPYFPDYSWQNYTEFYTPRYKDYFYHFDSFEELKNITDLDRDHIDPKGLRAKSMAFAVEDRNYQFQQMAIFFESKLHIALQRNLQG